MPREVTTNVQLELANRIRIPYFRGIFMRITLSIEGVRERYHKSRQCQGTHWMAYAKRGNHIVYFDYFGNLQPSKELERYLANSIIEYNRAPYQRYNQNNYGLCLQFLRLIDKQIKATLHRLTRSKMSLMFMLTGKSSLAVSFPAINLSDDNYELGLWNILYSSQCKFDKQ